MEGVWKEARDAEILPWSIDKSKLIYFLKIRKSTLHVPVPVVDLKKHLQAGTNQHHEISSYIFVKHTLFYKQRFFLTQPQCCLTFSCIELQMLLRCCLIHITINIPRHISYLVHVCPCLGLGMFMSYLCDLFFISSLLFVVINHINHSNRCICFLYIFQNIPYYLWMIMCLKKANNLQ